MNFSKSIDGLFIDIFNMGIMSVTIYGWISHIIMYDKNAQMYIRTLNFINVLFYLLTFKSSCYTYLLTYFSL